MNTLSAKCKRSGLLYTLSVQGYCRHFLLNVNVRGIILYTLSAKCRRSGILYSVHTFCIMYIIRNTLYNSLLARDTLKFP
jgi:hypothetical protein